MSDAGMRASAHDDAGAGAGGRPIRVLIVDDAADHARMWEILLGSESDMHVVGTLGSADDLGPTVARLTPDIVLLDLRMPGRDPLEALRDLAAERPECRVIVCSGLDDPEVRDLSRAAGAWGHFTKSREMDELLGVIRKVAGGERSW